MPTTVMHSKVSAERPHKMATTDAFDKYTAGGASFTICAQIGGDPFHAPPTHLLSRVCAADAPNASIS